MVRPKTVRRVMQMAREVCTEERCDLLYSMLGADDLAWEEIEDMADQTHSSDMVDVDTDDTAVANHVALPSEGADNALVATCVAQSECDDDRDETGSSTSCCDDMSSGDDNE